MNQYSIYMVIKKSKLMFAQRPAFIFVAYLREQCEHGVNIILANVIFRIVFVLDEPELKFTLIKHFCPLTSAWRVAD